MCESESGQVARAEGFDGRDSRPPGGDSRLSDRNRPVHHDDDDPTFILSRAIGRHVRWHVAGPGRAG